MPRRRTRQGPDRPFPPPASSGSGRAHAGTARDDGLPGSADGNLHHGVGLPDLDTEARRLIRDGLAPATRRAYRRCVATFQTFCASHNLPAIPATERTVLRFLAHLSLNNTSPGLASSHLAALRHWHATRERPWPGRTERIRLALRAISRDSQGPRPPGRRPASVPILLRLRRRLRRASMSAHDRRAAWAAITLGFFGALRGTCSRYGKEARTDKGTR
ncbi:uncharacterized protein LOC122375647 isoform X2 [Amphibalanus amphitrite]|uniref:uncharacterized protein LOC122375647 isoform X2 n=1 Tax=Amphibalanus amphitrite TaxID=1232801 RepID=UPI001C9202A1|nr:uncharacterized protein LOC122375647 isoform X2 [Amphibalanus amphitrite]